MHAVTFHAVDTQMKSMHKQGVGERSEPHSLYILFIILSKVVCVHVRASLVPRPRPHKEGKGSGDY